MNPGQPDPIDDFSDLFDDVKGASEHEIQLAIGAARRPKVPWRSVHPVISKFPDISDQALSELRADIQRNGQRKAICMYQGMVWDGRARYRACVGLGLVPRVTMLRRADPIIYLLRRHNDRFGLPRTPEREEALRILHEIDAPEWKSEAQKQRAAWIAEARTEFQQIPRQPKPCAVCGLSSDYSHAHHSLPLAIQYALGVDEPVQEHDWLCPVHHKLLHRHIAAHLIGSRWTDGGDYSHGYPTDQAREAAIKATAVLHAKARSLFIDVGGVPPSGNWSMLVP